MVAGDEVGRPAPGSANHSVPQTVRNTGKGNLVSKRNSLADRPRPVQTARVRTWG
jgi:hypothetical protein